MARAVMETMRQLVEAGVRSLEQLEILLVLAKDPARSCPTDTVRRTSMLTTQRGDELVEGLVRADLVSRERPDALRLGSKVSAPDLQALRAVYERDRAAVVNAFFACNLDSLRSFANAFKLRRND